MRVGAPARARRVMTEGEATFAHMVLGLALGFLGDPVAGEVHLVHAREVSAALDRHEDLMRAHLYLGEVLRLQGRFADSATLMREGETTARSVGLEGSFGRYMLVNAADDLFHLGRWGEAAAAHRRHGAHGTRAMEPAHATHRGRATRRRDGCVRRRRRSPASRLDALCHAEGRRSRLRRAALGRAERNLPCGEDKRKKRVASWPRRRPSSRSKPTT